MTTEQENLISKTNEISIYELWEVLFQNKFIILLVTFCLWNQFDNLCFISVTGTLEGRSDNLR